MTRIIYQTTTGIFLLLLILPPVKYFYFNSGHRWLYIFILSFIACYFILPFCRMVALKFNILDKPDWRKIHINPTPLLGGLGVCIAFLLSLLFNNVFLPGMKILLLGGCLIMIMGLWDDIRPLPALLKFTIQLIISLLVIILGDIQLTFFYNTSWAPLINIPMTLLWIVGLTNAMNFFDGMDGLATGISIIIATFLGIISFNTNQPALGWFSVAMAGSCMGFMPYNFRIGKPALLFLGDAGSTFLGFTLAGLAVLGQWSDSSHFVSLVAPILIFGILIFDMIYVNLSRIKNRKASNFFELLTCVNKDHLHHRLLFMGFSQKEAVSIIAVMSSCLGVSALIIMNQKVIEGILGLMQAIMILGLIVILMLKGRDIIPNEGERRGLKRRQEDRKAPDPM
ncbi:undecaprenyl/decaprenyl-phosphate alpha-N-acetylglucosaminyl 1-phosphate transferase [Deltaproteobacteria bacterium]|nr:undecaprenyl/decaprenyl-phosphate alpha-N-acetylglucosaminyl 1-phosphate transferase [Deltaproteobacteria bacterium]